MVCQRHDLLEEKCKELEDKTNRLSELLKESEQRRNDRYELLVLVLIVQLVVSFVILIKWFG